jgi:hypothetical protein
VPAFEANRNPNNPFDFGTAATGPDAAKVQDFQVAVNAWKESRDKIRDDLFPQLDRAIGAVQSYATVIQTIVNMIQSQLPLTGPANPVNEERVQNLAAQSAQMTQIAGMLSNVKTMLPTTTRIVNTLLADLG